MTRYIAFLRAINVGGHVVKMDDLRALFESMKFANVETYIASGNVIFQTDRKDCEALRGRIESSLRNSLGYEVTTFLRTAAEVVAIAGYQPFPQAAVASAAAYCVGFLAAPLGEEAARRALALKAEVDDFHLHGCELYWLTRLKQSESKFSNAVFEKATGTRITFRNRNTIQKLAAKYPV